jgi:hypothetical protein
MRRAIVTLIPLIAQFDLAAHPQPHAPNAPQLAAPTQSVIVVVAVLLFPKALSMGSARLLAGSASGAAAARGRAGQLAFHSHRIALGAAEEDADVGADEGPGSSQGARQQQQQPRGLQGTLRRIARRFSSSQKAALSAAWRYGQAATATALAVEVPFSRRSSFGSSRAPSSARSSIEAFFDLAGADSSASGGAGPSSGGASGGSSGPASSASPAGRSAGMRVLARKPNGGGMAGGGVGSMRWQPSMSRITSGKDLDLLVEVAGPSGSSGATAASGWGRPGGWGCMCRTRWVCVCVCVCV